MILIITANQAGEDGQIPLSIVTACVDEIRFFPEFHDHSARDEDLIVSGQVCWVGRSSMDVLVWGQLFIWGHTVFFYQWN